MEKLKRYKRLEESSLSRIWQHVTDEDSSFAVVSAYRGIYSEDENLKRHNELRIKILIDRLNRLALSQ